MAFLCCLCGGWAQCFEESTVPVDLPLDFDALLGTFDRSLQEDFPQWAQRFNQINTADPTPQFRGEDNCGNGIHDDDHLDLLAALLTGEPVSEVLAGVNAAQVSSIRSAFASNFAKIRDDLTLRVSIVTLNVMDAIEDSNPGFAADLKNLVAAYMTLGDAESVAFIRGVVITLGELAIEEGVSSGSVPGYLGNKVKEALRDAVNENFQAPHYDCFGDASGASEPNLLGDTGDLPGTGTSNVDAFTTAQSRQAWLISRGVSHPPLQIISFPEALSVQSGDEATFSVTVTGGDGSTVGYDWRHSGVHVGAFSTLSWDYALPSDTGDYVVYVCDDTWQRSSLPVELVVSLRTFSITTQPQAAEVPQSDAHAFSVVVTGGGSMPTYQWYYGATEETLSPIAGATEAVLTFDALAMSDTGWYQVHVSGTGEGGTPVVLESDVVALTVLDGVPSITLKGDNPMTVACGDSYVESGATAYDEVDGDLTEAVTVTGEVDCGTMGTYYRLYRVEDSVGNVREVKREVQVVDHTAPVLTLLGDVPLLHECAAVFVDPGATAFDECAGDLSASVMATTTVETTTPGWYDCVYRVSDTAGNQAQLTRTVQVVDTTPPQITLLGSTPYALECASTFTDPGVVAADACTGDLTTQVAVSDTPLSGGVEGFLRTYRVSDSAGNERVMQRRVEVVDTVAPAVQLLGANAMELICGNDFVDPGATALDVCDGDLSAAITTTVLGDLGTAGETKIRYSVSDEAGNMGSVERTVTVLDVDNPVLTLLGDDPLLIPCGQTFVDPGVTATDQCDGDITDKVVHMGTVDTSLLGEYTVRYSVLDASGKRALASRNVIVSDTDGPVITLQGASSMQIACQGVYVEPGAVAVDMCEGDLSSALQISGTVDTSQPGIYTIRYAACDGKGNCSEQQRRVEVTDEQAPTLTLLGDNPISLECGESYVEPGATASDLCAGDLSAQVAVKGDVLTKEAGVFVRTYTVADPTGNKATLTRQVIVSDTQAPTLSMLGEAQTTVECGDTYTDAGATAIDACEGDLTADIQVVGTVNTTLPGVYMLGYRVQDSGGKLATQQRSVTVQDTTPPQLLLLGATELQLDCGEEFVEPGATAQDSCSGDLSAQIVMEGAVDCETPGSYERVYTVQDAAGLGSKVTRTVLVRDNCPLVIEQQPRSVRLYENTSYTLEVRAQGGTGTLRYTWEKDGVGIPNSNTPLLTLASLTISDTGEYHCVIRDDLTSLATKTVTVNVFSKADTGHHAADISCDWRLSVGELLRGIQLYNTVEFHCDANGEDGYALGNGARSCKPHDSDYADQDWKIDLSELLRLIQFFNSPQSAYHKQTDTEDGFAPCAG